MSDKIDDKAVCYTKLQEMLDQQNECVKILLHQNCHLQMADDKTEKNYSNDADKNRTENENKETHSIIPNAN